MAERERQPGTGGTGAGPGRLASWLGRAFRAPLRPAEETSGGGATGRRGPRRRAARGSAPPSPRRGWSTLAVWLGIGALLVVAAGAYGLWRQRQGDPWARYRPVPLDPGKTYELVLWETELPVAVIPDPLRLPEGPSPDPRHVPPSRRRAPGSGPAGPGGPGSSGGAGQGEREGGRRRDQPPPVPPLAGPGPFTHREYLDQALKAFAREHPNIRVRVEMVPASEAAGRLRRALADGKPPDVFGGWGGALPARHPLQVPLNPYLTRAERRWVHPTALALYRVDRRDWVWPRWVAPQTWWADAGLIRAAGLDPDRLALTGWTYGDVARLARVSREEAGAGGDAQAAPQADGRDGAAVPGLVLWADRPDLPLQQLLRARGVTAPLSPAGTVLWAGPEGQDALTWLQDLRAARLAVPVAGEGVEPFLAQGGRILLGGGFTPGLARWVLERETGIAPGRQPEQDTSRAGAGPVTAGHAGGDAAGTGHVRGAEIPPTWPLPAPPGPEAEPLVPPGFDGPVLLPPPVPAGQPRPSLVEVGGLAVFRQARYRGDDHTQAAVELARFLSRWRTDVLTRRMLAVPADVTSLAAWREESPLPAVYRRQLEHLSLGMWNPGRRGRWARLAVSYPVAPGVAEPELEEAARRLWPPLAEFWAGRRDAAGVIRAWGGPLQPAPGGSGPRGG